MANRFTRKYDPDKRGNTSRFRNQGYSGENLTTVKQRRESYDKWLLSDDDVYKHQQEKGPHDQLGSVSSSWLTSLGYNATTGEAVATFKDSNQEFYYKMDYDEFLEWLNSPSKGIWLHNSPYLHNYTTRGGGRKSFESRVRGFKGNNNGAKRAKSRQSKYLAKYR